VAGSDQASLHFLFSVSTVCHIKSMPSEALISEVAKKLLLIKDILHTVCDNIILLVKSLLQQTCGKETCRIMCTCGNSHIAT